MSAAGQHLFRLVQEDFCQATGVSPLAKYENEGGPGLKQIFTLVQQSQQAKEDMRTLMASQLLFWMLRAPDGHAKNFSIQLLAGTGRFKLTPIHDVMSAYPAMGPGPNQWSEHEVKMAMALLGKNRHDLARDIQRRHFNSTAKKVGYGDNAEPLLQEFIARTPDVVEKVRGALPDGFSAAVADNALDRDNRCQPARIAQTQPCFLRMTACASSIGQSP
jgi:serine/threonine-protein kinase HipA